MGGDTNVEAPAPPAPISAPESSGQAIQAQIDALPKIYQAQIDYGPKFSQMNLESLEKYGPEFAQAALDLQKQFGPQFAQVERDLAPELAGAQSTLSNFLNQTDQQEYDALAPGLLQQIRAGHSQRGLGAISPLGAIDEGVQLAQLKQSLKDRRLNVALSTAGRVPIGQMPSVQGQNGVGQLVQNVSPDSVMGYNQGLNNFKASVFGSQSNMYGSQLANQGDPWGSILGGAAGSATGAFGTAAGTAAFAGL